MQGSQGSTEPGQVVPEDSRSRPRDSSRQSDFAYDELKELIVTTQLPPDSLISEREMMDRLAVGRTPLREALQRLTSDHLVRSVPRRGYFVAGVTYAGLLHSYEIRRSVESLAARLAAERGGAEDHESLRELLREAEQGIHTESTHWHLTIDARLHDLVAQASGNPFILQMVGEMYDVSVRELYLSQRPVRVVVDEIENYRCLVDAICRGDGDAAEQAMLDHLAPDALEVAQRELWARAKTGAS